jgi:hypothetical protein
VNGADLSDKSYSSNVVWQRNNVDGQAMHSIAVNDRLVHKAPLVLVRMLTCDRKGIAWDGLWRVRGKTRQGECQNVELDCVMTSCSNDKFLSADWQFRQPTSIVAERSVSLLP